MIVNFFIFNFSLISINYLIFFLIYENNFKPQIFYIYSKIVQTIHMHSGAEVTSVDGFQMRMEL